MCSNIAYTCVQGTEKRTEDEKESYVQYYLSGIYK